MNIRKYLVLFFAVFHFWEIYSQPGDYLSHTFNDNQVIFETTNGNRLRIRFYKDDVVRFQWVKKDEDFFADDRYEMVVEHNLKGNYELREKSSEILLKADKFTIEISKSPLRVSIRDNKTWLLE